MITSLSLFSVYNSYIYHPNNFSLQVQIATIRCAISIQPHLNLGVVARVMVVGHRLTSTGSLELVKEMGVVPTLGHRLHRNTKMPDQNWLSITLHHTSGTVAARHGTLLTTHRSTQMDQTQHMIASNLMVV